MNLSLSSMDKPTVIIDKSLLQPICALPGTRSKDCLRFLKDNFTIYVPPMLTEEISANYYHPIPDIPKHLAAKMLTAISDFHWMEHPLELVYQEVVLKRSPSAGFGLNLTATSRYRDWMDDLNGHLVALKGLFRSRHERKQKAAAENRRFQEPLKDPTNFDALNFSDRAAFVQYVLDPA